MVRRQSTHNAANRQEVADEKHQLPPANVNGPCVPMTPRMATSDHRPQQVICTCPTATPSRVTVPRAHHRAHAGIMSRMGIDVRTAPDPHAHSRQAGGRLRHSLSPVSTLVLTMMGDRTLSVTDPHERKWALRSC